ncbi:MAG: Rieske 2Fe-2S domain-containing protein [Chloroflexota bacterium]|nr:Rieske 2Fe-2S domain-containing protein [Chloroflexota bacterium]
MGSPRNTAGHAVTKNAKWLDGVANVFGAIVEGFYKLPGTGAINALLHGTWPLGHPLHPAITDVTIGAYSATFALDVLYLFTSETALFRAADFVLIVAFASSIVSILSGLTDWSDTNAEERRTGMLHGLIMVAATVLFVSSILIRLNGGFDQRSLAIALSGLGWLVMLVGAFFGGEMPYGYGTQVNRQAWSQHSTKWQKLDITASKLEDRKPVVGTSKGTEIFVVKLDEKLYAMGNQCTHAGGPLNEGKFVGTDRCEIECPWHGSRFCVKDGDVRQAPATFPEPRYEVRVGESGAVEVRAV